MKRTIVFFIWFMTLAGGYAQTVDRTLLFADVRELSADKYQGRKTGTEGNRQAAEYIIKRYKQIGLKPFKGSYNMPFSFKRQGKTVSGTNLIGYIQGKKNEVIVVSAHYDHLGVINRQIYNGADDNASGVGGLLAIAASFKKNSPEHTLIIAAFDAEEMGLQGAKAFITAPPVPLSSVKLNINLDMISHNDQGELYAAGTYHYPKLKEHLLTTNSTIKLLTGHDRPELKDDDWTGQSDHAVFHARKIPFLYFGVEDHQDYHRPTDVFENINQEFYVNAVNMILEVVRNIDQDITAQKILRSKKIM